jgi:phospholysine phosphohistidine inorganic pyrophosphate phosphatase
MVGDDIENDVGGAQAAGIRGLLVRTGKFRPSDENHPNVTPNAIVDNLKQAIDIMISNQANIS